MSPSSIDIDALRERLTPAADPEAATDIAAAYVGDEQGFIYWPNLLGRHQLTSLTLQEVRKRSQWLCINTAARVLRRLTRYVGTSSIKPDTLDGEFNADVQRWWKDEYQDHAGNYEMSGKYSSCGYLTNCLYQAWRDSDVLSLHLTAPDGSPTCAAVEAARIETPWNQAYNSKWQDGVLTDFFYKHEAYAIAVDRPGSGAQYSPRNHVIIPAGHAHLFGDFETQASTRGTPALIHAVADLLDEREIHNSAIATVKAHGQVGYYFKKALGTPSGPGVNFSVPGAKEKRTAEPGTANLPANVAKSNANKVAVAQVMSRADIVDTPAGYEIETVTDGRDHPNETEIKNGIYRKMALGMGLPVEVFILLDQLTGPGVRFVLRQTQDWREYWLKSMETFQSVDYVRRLEYAMRTGRVRKCKDPNFGRHYFVKPRAITIDDGRSATAVVAEYFAGLTNLAQIHGERGNEWKEETTQNIVELRHILDECKRLGVPPEMYFERQKALLQLSLNEEKQNAAANKEDKAAA